MFFLGRQSQAAQGPVYPYPMYDTLTGKKVVLLAMTAAVPDQSEIHPMTCYYLGYFAGKLGPSGNWGRPTRPKLFLPAWSNLEKPLSGNPHPRALAAKGERAAPRRLALAWPMPTTSPVSVFWDPTTPAQAKAELGQVVEMSPDLVGARIALASIQ